MASNRKLLVLPGDGIGPEVVSQVLRVVDWLAAKRSVSFDLQEGLVGGAAYDTHGTPLTDETLSDALAADAILFGSVGGPQYDDLPFELKPERGLLRLRKEMDLFANGRFINIKKGSYRGIRYSHSQGINGRDLLCRAERY